MTIRIKEGINMSEKPAVNEINRSAKIIVPTYNNSGSHCLKHVELPGSPKQLNSFAIL